MSGIYIKGMKMPKSCIKCKLLNWKPSKKHYRCPLTNEKIDDDTELSWGYMSKDCPLIEVPKHGRLIDKDELLKPVGSYEPIHYSYVDGYVVPLRDISNAPTIIESDGE